MSSLAWKFNRLKLMSPAEIAWRVSKHGQKLAAKHGIGTASRPPAASSAAFGKPFIHLSPGADDAAALLAEANRILDGRWRVFAMHEATLGFPPEWNRDPKTGTLAPLMPGKSIDYRREQIVGDIKYLWEPSRHLELVTLALAFRVSGDGKYLAACRVLLDSWFEQCPYPLGVHWTSSLELAVRLVNWAFAWHLIGGEKSVLFADADGAAFRERWLANVYQHCHFISGYFSRHSSANNHLFGEYMGLFVASLNWPCWPQSARWAALAKAGLEREALRQNFADGVNKEQAVYYQHEVMDMMLLCHLVGRANDVSFSAGYLDRLECLGEFVAALMDCSGNIPMIGDSDDAQMVRFGYGEDRNPYRSLLASCAILFSRADFKQKAGALDDKNRWLFGHDGLAAWASLPAVSETLPRKAFPEGGYWVLGADFDSPDEVKAVVDAGPLGYLSIAAHGHADALAMTLSVGGVAFLVDPGTYAYHTQKRWRDYFRGTSAHNTVRVDGEDQSVIGGNFMWLQKANACCEAWETTSTRDFFVGSHDGYLRLPDGVLHRRSIEFDKVRRQLRVVDFLKCSGKHEIELFWHFSDDCSVEFSGDRISATKYGRNIFLAFFGTTCEATLHRGDEELPLGWISHHFDTKTPTTTLRRRTNIADSAEFVTEISY